MPAGTFHPWATTVRGEPCLSHIYNGTLYTAATNGTGSTPQLYGYGLANATAWLINSTVVDPGCEEYSFFVGTQWHQTMDMVHGTSLYFQGREGSWQGIFGYGLENNTLWKVAAAAPQTGLSVSYTHLTLPTICSV